MSYSKQKSRESRTAIERLYVTMRQLLIRGSYKPSGLSGEALKKALLLLSPEIYGDLNDSEKLELNGLLYVAERLPMGIEECRFIQLIAKEGYQQAGHMPIIPLKRRRNCYRIDKQRMCVEMSRGRSDIYDIITHLTFLNIEADKIMQKALDHKGKVSNNWTKLEEVVTLQQQGEEVDEKKALVYLSNAIGRTVHATKQAVEKFEKSGGCNSLYHFVYWLGKLSMDSAQKGNKREIIVSAKLNDVIGHHVYGEQWATNIKNIMQQNNWLQRPIDIISANLHSVLNAVYGFDVFPQKFDSADKLAAFTSSDAGASKKIKDYALKNGMREVEDNSGTNLTVQLMDLAQLQNSKNPYGFNWPTDDKAPLLLVMDYAFGEQAYECMDELLKPFEHGEEAVNLNVRSISVMGKAGILKGNKGDIMIPTAHVFEGTADNYPLENDLQPDDFKDLGQGVYEGTMITVLGTSLQNKDVLQHFLTSTWNGVGLEMEGAHYQKAIQSAAKIRKSIDEEVKVRYAYYASDNPLKTGATLASGSLGADGIGPTYAITVKILEKIFEEV